MPLVTRQYGPDAKNLKLSFYDMDMNLYYLQELGVSGFSYLNGIIEISNPTGGTKDVTINIVTGFTYDNLNTFTITDNYNNNFSATINTVTGLTVNGTISATTYQNLPPASFTGGTVNGFTEFTNGLNVDIISATTYQNLPDNVTGNYLPLSGGTVTGSTSFTNGLTANTISATTYQNLPIDPNTYVTGFTYGGNVFTVKQNNGQPDLTATIDSVTGMTVNGNLTVTGNTSVQGLTATTISATTYQNLPIDPDTYVTGYTYNDNTFTIKQNNGQPDLTALINSVTGWTVNGNLTVTGNTSVQGLTATTIDSGTVTVTNTSGTPSQAASFDSTGKLVAGLGQTTFSAFGTSTLVINNTTTTFTIVPGLTQTFTVPTNCSVYVLTTGGIGNTNGSNYSFTTDFSIFVDGVGLTQGGYGRVNTFNPATTNAGFTNTTWSISTILNLSAGSHTIDLRVVYRNTSNAAQGASVSSPLGSVRQGELYIMVIKN